MAIEVRVNGVAVGAAELAGDVKNVYIKTKQGEKTRFKVHPTAETYIDIEFDVVDAQLDNAADVE